MAPYLPATEKVVHIHLDPVGGASGDMFISAILDARPELEPGLTGALSAAGIPQTVQVGRIVDRRGGITGSRFVVDGVNAPRAPATLREFRSLIASGALSPSVHERAVAILTLLAEVEAEIHGVPVDEVGFHELGDWDTLVDSVAAAWLVEELGCPVWSVSALPLGSGVVQTAHGRLPVPAPATARLLEGFMLRDDGISGERVTPTGAAILAHLQPVKPAQTWSAPALRLAGSGHGLGTRELESTPNLLRALLFTRGEQTLADERIGIIRFEVDDQTGEDLAYALDRLRAVPGIRDVCQWMAVGKQGRMMAAIQILCDPDVLYQASMACLNETSTIGLRTAVETRYLLPRETLVTEAAGRPAVIKRVTRPSGTQTAKIEFASLAERGADFAQRARIKRLAEGASLEELP